MDNSSFIEDCEKNCAPGRNDKLQKDKSLEASSYTFEEAIELTGTGKFHYLLLFTCGLCFLTIMSQTVAISVVLPAIKCDLPASVSEQGLLASAAFIGVVCSSHAMGFLADTWGRVNTVKWSLILSTIVAIISSFSVNIWMLIVTRFLTGLFVSGCQASVYTLCSEFHSNKTRSRHVTLISVFLSMAVIYVPVEAAFILPLNFKLTIFGLVMHPWRFQFLAINLSPVLALILLHFIPNSPKYELIHGNHEKAINTMRYIFAMNTKRPREEYPVEHIKLEMSGANITDIRSVKDAVKMVWRQTIPVFYKERILQTLNICLILFITYGIGHGLFTWYPTILNDAINRDGDYVCTIIKEVDITSGEHSSVCLDYMNPMTFWIVAFIGLFLTVVYLIFSFTINIFGKRNILIVWLIICGLSCIVIQWVTSLPVIILALMTLLSACNSGGIIGTIAVEFYPTNINAMAVCFVMMVGRLGVVAGNNIFGRILFDYCETTFWSIAGVLFLMAFMTWLLPEKKRQKPIP